MARGPIYFLPSQTLALRSAGQSRTRSCLPTECWPPARKKYPDMPEMLIDLTGWAPLAGYHLNENRKRKRVPVS